jgi:hypothetical protein
MLPIHLRRLFFVSPSFHSTFFRHLHSFQASLCCSLSFGSLAQSSLISDSALSLSRSRRLQYIVSFLILIRLITSLHLPSFVYVFVQYPVLSITFDPPLAFVCCLLSALICYLCAFFVFVLDLSIFPSYCYSSVILVRVSFHYIMFVVSGP